MEAPVRIHATAQLDTLAQLLAELPPPLSELIPQRGAIPLIPLNVDGPEYRSVFAGQTTRARTSNQGDVYLDTGKVNGVASLRALLYHELAHGLQFALGRPLWFAPWTRLHDLAFWTDKARSLLQTVSDRSGLKEVVAADPVGHRPAAVRLLNVFADADAHAFLLDRGLLDLDAYAEALNDYLADLRSSPQRSESRPLPQLWLEYRRFPSRPLRVASQSWPVLMEWLTIVGGRWARVGTLLGRADAAAVVAAYVGPDRQALQEHMGDFADDRVFDGRWQEMVGAGDDMALLWKTIQRLATDAVSSVRAICDR
jgi:hypothetical protein